jgi:hypothetical protein
MTHSNEELTQLIVQADEHGDLAAPEMASLFRAIEFLDADVWGATLDDIFYAHGHNVMTVERYFELKMTTEFETTIPNEWRQMIFDRLTVQS